MIKINLQTPENLKRNQMIADFVNAHRAKSFGDRNPHLGKMKNCHVCSKRHHSSVHCTASYATHDRHGDPYYEDGTPMIAPLPDQQPVTPVMQRNCAIGRAAFARKRWAPHQHLNKSQVLERNAAKNKRKRRQSDVSRRINAGLAIPGSRP